MVLVYTTLLNDVAKPTIILWVMVLFLMLALYISYIYYTRIQKPMYLSKINYDAYENQTFANQPLTRGGSNNSSNFNTTTGGNKGTNIPKTTTNSGKRIPPKVDITKLQDFANLRSCPQGECSIKTSGNLIGVKRCPATSSGIVMYDITQEECVVSNKCPPEIPYAQQLNGEALTGVCEEGNDGCNCLVQPQCATYVTKYFDNVGLGNYGQGSTGLNYAFSISGSKNNQNFYNPLQIEFNKLGKIFCKINPAFVDTIINGCPLTNHWTDPMNCSTYENVIFSSNSNLTVTVQSPSSVYTYFNATNIPKNISPSVFFNSANNLPIIVNGLNLTPPQELPNIGFFFKNDNKNVVFRYTGYDKAIINISKGENFYILKNVSYYDSTDNIFKPGLNNLITSGNNLTFNYFNFTFCNDSAVNGANLKSMLMCVQDKNQPCTSGTLAYNFDRQITTTNNSRNFCQAYAQPGVDRLEINSNAQASIQTFYLTDPAYFTQSCVVGYGCGETIDFTLCDPDSNDCAVAIKEKKDRFFPVFDDSAVSNVWQIEPEYIQFNSYGTSMLPLSSSLGSAFYLKNNLFQPENGDYWQINNRPINDIFLMQKPSANGKNLLLNTTNGLSINDTILNPKVNGNTVIITNISGNEITISEAITEGVSPLFKAGTHLLFNNISSSRDYGIIRTDNNDSRNPFYLLNLLDLSNQNLPQQAITDKGIYFFKQFGFNGLNYGTCYNVNTFEREYTDSYQYGKYNKMINPSLSIAETPPFIVENLISNYSAPNALTTEDYNKQVFTTASANFKQKNSMYYPVWNEDNFKQECVFCSPSLYALPVISEKGNLTAVTIQFSGKDFYQYTKDINSQIFVEAGGSLPVPEYFMYTMYSLTSSKNNEKSTASAIYLNNPNIDVQVGDFIIDASGILAVKVLDANSNDVTTSITKSNLTTFEVNFESQIASNKPALLPSHLTTSIYNNQKLAPNLTNTNIYPSTNFGGTQNKVNLFAGKQYYLTGSTDGGIYYIIVPTIQVSSIGLSGRLIFTDSSQTTPLPKNTLLQFIRPTSIISLSLQGDIDAASQKTSYANQPVYAGTGAEIFVNEITDGRITNIKIDKQGSNYLVTNKPLLFVSGYKIDSNIPIIS